MGQLKLFRLTGSSVAELPPTGATVEKRLQSTIEQHAEELLGITILASEFWTGKLHRGRIDSLGIDENNAPVIVEYKRSLNENIVAQGLFYLNWLLDHRGDFERLVREKLGARRADAIDWSAPRIACIAGDFTRYDEHAVREINRNIDLIRYRKYGQDLLLLELIHAAGGTALEEEPDAGKPRVAKPSQLPRAYSVEEHLNKAQPRVRDLFVALRDQLLTFGDDVELAATQQYVAFRRLKNFACAVIQSEKILLTLKLDPTSVTLEKGFTRDVTSIGHWGTGNLEVTLRTPADLEKAKPLLSASYEAS